MIFSRRFSLVLIFLLLGGCSSLDSSRLAYSNPDDEDGIGGTGKTVAMQTSNTWVQGRINAFGSIYVNGLRIRYEDDTPVTENGLRTNTKSLKVGQVVEVSAAQRLFGTRGMKINIRHEVVGEVTRVYPHEGAFMVMKQKVNVATKGVRMPSPGDRVKVSGFRDGNDVVHATHIDRTGNRRQVLRGELVQSMGNWFVRGVAVIPASGMKLKEGTRVTVHGVYRDGALNADKIMVNPSASNNRQFHNLFVQGYLVKDAGKLKIDNIEIEITNGTVEVKVGEMVQLVLARDSQGSMIIRKFIQPGNPAGNPATGRSGGKGRPNTPPGLENKPDSPPGVANRPDLPEPDSRPELPETPGRPELPEHAKGRKK